MVLSLVPNMKVGYINVSACTTSDFILSNINNDQSKTNLGCFTTFVSAKSSMNNYSSAYNNLIITHSKSLSPLKIVAASRAIAASYPLRRTDNFKDNSITLTIHQYSDSSGNFSGFNTYMQAYRDLFYYSTEFFDPQTGNGTAFVEVNGFKGYVHIKSIDIIPLIYVEKGWSITLGGNTYEEVIKGSTTEEKPFTLIPKANKYRVYSRIGYLDANGVTQNIREIGHETFSMYSGSSLSEYVYGKAPDWLPNGIYYSSDSIRFYYDPGLKNPVKNGDVIGEYYNYYQYLPLRSVSNLNSTDFDTYINALGYTSIPTSYATRQNNQSMMVNQGANFKLGESKYGINALLLFALAMHESGSGRSAIAIDYKNLYGWGAFDTNVYAAKKFDDISSSIFEFMGVHIRGFLSIENWRFFSSSLGTKNSGIATKYASDPYWANKIAGWAYRIDRYSGFKDYNYYVVGKYDDGLPYDVKNDSTLESSTYYSYNSQIGLNKIRNYTFVINDTFIDANSSQWFETFSTQPIDNNGNAVFFKDSSSETSLIDYFWRSARSYINSDKFKIISNGVGYQHIPYSYNELKSVWSSTNNSVISYDPVTNTFGIVGSIYKHGVTTDNFAKVKYSLDLVDQAGTTTSIQIDTSSIKTSDLTALYGNSEFVYDYSGYLKSGIDFSQLNLPDGVYKLQIGVNVNGLVKSKEINYRKPILINDFTEVYFEKNNADEISKLISYNLKNVNDIGLILVIKQSNAEETIPNFIHFGNMGEQLRLEIPDSYSNITFFSSDPNIVNIAKESIDGIETKNGVISSISEGSAYVSVLENETIEIGRIYVLVEKPTRSFDLKKSNINFTQLGVEEVISKTEDSDNIQLDYYSLNPSIATVSREGVVAPVSNGYTTIKVISSDGLQTKDIQVTVNISATSMQLNKENGLLVTNLLPQQIYPTFDANNAILQDITWSSSNDSIVKVLNGKLSAVANGYATITAKLNDSVYSTLDVRSIILGDYNKDNKTDLLDLVTLRRYLTNQATFDSESLDYGDVNRDGKVDLLDLVKLRRILVGME